MFFLEYIYLLFDIWDYVRFFDILKFFDNLFLSDYNYQLTYFCILFEPIGNIKQLKLAFSADGEKITGTCRIDYIWLGKWVSEGVGE